MRIRKSFRAQQRDWCRWAGVLALLCGMLCGAPSALAGERKKLEWQYHVIGTPEFMGPPKILEKGFISPIPIKVQTPEKCSCRGGRISGEFEAYISATGRVEDVHSHHQPVAGTPCQQQCSLSIVKSWHFQPATFAGKPTPVYMWIGVDVDGE